jgi:hypothetical protein
LPGRMPSVMQKMAVRMWSAITRMAMSVASLWP